MQNIGCSQRKSQDLVETPHLSPHPRARNYNHPCSLILLVVPTSLSVRTHLIRARQPLIKFPIQSHLLFILSQQQKPSAGWVDEGRHLESLVSLISEMGATGLWRP